MKPPGSFMLSLPLLSTYSQNHNAHKLFILAKYQYAQKMTALL